MPDSNVSFLIHWEGNVDKIYADKIAKVYYNKHRESFCFYLGNQVGIPAYSIDELFEKRFDGIRRKKRYMRDDKSE